MSTATVTDPASRYAWSDVRPKVSAAGLAAYFALAVQNVLSNELNIDVSAETSLAVGNALVLLVAYLWPDK